MCRRGARRGHPTELAPPLRGRPYGEREDNRTDTHHASHCPSNAQYGNLKTRTDAPDAEARSLADADHESVARTLSESGADVHARGEPREQDAGGKHYDGCKPGSSRWQKLQHDNGEEADEEHGGDRAVAEADGDEVGGGDDEIGRTHVRTPVTWPPRMT